MAKLKRGPKNLELDINVAKMGNSVFFHGKQQMLKHCVKIRVPHNTTGRGD